jgi:hypothetical protein
MNSGIPHEVSIRHPRVPDEPFVRPDWVPEYGHALRLAGVHFDAVRIHGCRGEEIMAALMDWQGWAAGPIIHMATTNEVTFLLPVGSARAYRWPTDVRFQVLPQTDDDASFVGIPAMNGATWPLLWRSLPTADAPFVNTGALYEVVRRNVTGHGLNHV